MSVQFDILLVEDSQHDAKLFEKALRDGGTRANLYWVATANEALEYLHRQGRFQQASAPSIIVCDLNMPGMDGFDLLAEVKKNPALALLPFIVFSASKWPRDIHRSYALGASSFIVKPMTMESLVDKLSAMVRYWLDIVELSNADHLD